MYLRSKRIPPAVQVFLRISKDEDSPQGMDTGGVSWDVVVKVGERRGLKDLVVMQGQGVLGGIR